MKRGYTSQKHTRDQDGRDPQRTAVKRRWRRTAQHTGHKKIAGRVRGPTGYVWESGRTRRIRA
jgi:hypothetical protein